MLIKVAIIAIVLYSAFNATWGDIETTKQRIQAEREAISYEEQYIK